MSVREEACVCMCVYVNVFWGAGDGGGWTAVCMRCTVWKNRMDGWSRALELVLTDALPPNRLYMNPHQTDEADWGTLFSIELNERVYTLKAADQEEARKWVEVLNQLKVT